MLPQINVSVIQSKGSPLFVVEYKPSLEKGFNAILGHTRAGDFSVFPAFPPYGHVVADDLRKIFGDTLSWNDNALEYIAASEEATLCVDEERVPEGLLDGVDFTYTPLEHQLHGLVRGFLFPRTGLFFDCGLGKTKVAIDILRLAKRAGETTRALVLCPSATVTRNWWSEIDLHGRGELTQLPICTTTGNALTKKKRLAAYAAIKEDPTNVMVMTYGTLLRDWELVASAFNPNMLVVDESHYLATHDSERTKTLLQLLNHLSCHRRIFLTGTPSQGDPRHVYGQLRAGVPFLAGDNFWRFQYRYCDLKPFYLCAVCHKYTRPTQEGKAPKECGCGSTGFKRANSVTGYKNLHVLRRVVGRFAIRRTADECADLPDHWVHDVPYWLDRNDKKFYNTLVKERNALLANGVEVDGTEAIVLLGKLLQTLSGYVTTRPGDPKNEKKDTELETFQLSYKSKLQALHDLVSAIVANQGDKALIWCSFKEEMRQVEKYLVEEKISYVRVDGATKNRAAVEKRFNTDPACKIYLGQVETGIGVNLVAANYTIYYGLPRYNWLHYEQSLRRNIRLGQTRPVTVYRLYVPHSVHMSVIAALENKADIAATLGKNALCLTCKHQPRCLAEAIQPFTLECSVAKDRASPVRANLALLP